MPPKNKVTLPCEVRHVSLREGTRDFDVGVQFAALDPEAKKNVETALKTLDGK